MKKAPSTVEVSGARGEQISMPPQAEFCPNLPKQGSLPFIALAAMAKEPITQIDWLEKGYGWRLSSTINKLNNFGWNVQSRRVDLRGTTIAIYSLKESTQQMVSLLLEGVKSGKN